MNTTPFHLIFIGYLIFTSRRHRQTQSKMAVSSPVVGHVFCPEYFTRDLSTIFLKTSPPELQDRAYSPQGQNGEEFETHATNNTICAFLNIGSVQHPESFLSTDIPFYCCNFCDFQTVQKTELQKHLQIHRFGCKFCNMELFTRAEVIRHAVECHKAEVAYEIIRYCVFSRESNGVVENSEVNLRQKTSSRKRNLECEQFNYLPNKTIKVEPIDDVSDQCAVQSNHLNDLNETSSVSNHSFSNESTRALEQNSDENVSNTSMTGVNDSPSTSARPLDTSRSFLRSILTSDRTGKLSPVNIIKNEGGNAFQPGVRMVSLLKNPVIPQNTSDGKEKQDEKTKDSVDYPKVKIEVDNDSYIARLQYHPQIVSRPDSNGASTESDSSQPTEQATHKHTQDNLATASHHPPRKYQSNQGYDTPRTRKKSLLSRDKEAKSLPILRTMLTKPDRPSRSSARHQLSTDSNEDQIKEDDDEEEEDDDDDYDDYDVDDDDEDYRPSSFMEEQTPRSKNRCSPRVRKDVEEFSCVHCQGNTGKFAQVKEHMFAEHRCSNLVLKDSVRNIMVYICPMDCCKYRDPRFPNFVKHLETCGVFKQNCSTSSRADAKRIQVLVLMTLRSLLENVQTEWNYACNICAHLFNSLADAQKHKMKKHSNCNDDKSLFKNCPETNEVGVMCLLCSTEFDVLDWPELSKLSCARHQAHSARNNKLDKTPQSSLKGYLISTERNEKVSEPPSVSKDKTPQLRAILQNGPGRVYRNPQHPQPSDLPASRMLQWLIKEGGRMMHLLKE